MDLHDILAAAGMRLVVIRDNGGEGDPVAWGAADVGDGLVWLWFNGEEVTYPARQAAADDIYTNSHTRLALRWCEEGEPPSVAHDRMWSFIYGWLLAQGSAEVAAPADEAERQGFLGVVERALTNSPAAVTRFKNLLRRE